MIVNKSSIAIEMIPEAIEEAIGFFLSRYPCHPECRYKIVLCEDYECLQTEWREYYGYGPSRKLPLHYDGQFLVPAGKTDSLTILVRIDASVITGARQYYKEKKSGIEMPSEERGLKLLSFFHFLELLCHEFSHLCSYDRMMSLASWSDPQIHSHNYDYHLHDEFIARIRGVETMLRMCCPYMETDLIYSLYMGLMQDTRKQFQERVDGVKKWIGRMKKDLEAELPAMQRREGMNDQEMLESLEYELGHKLQYGWGDGRIRLSDLEAVEFSAVDEMAEKLKPYIYFLKNPYAVYEGTQFTGTLAGFYTAFCGDETGWELELEKVINRPFWEYMDVKIIKKQDEIFREWLMNRPV